MCVEFLCYVSSAGSLSLTTAMRSTTSTSGTSLALTGGTLKTTESTAVSTSSTLLVTGEDIIGPPPPSLSLCLLRSLSPSLPCRLKPLDIEFMQQLHHLVNIIPVIAKADTLTPREIKALKIKVTLSSCTSKRRTQLRVNTSLLLEQEFLMIFIGCVTTCNES